jgi:CheY-like chemotaxis protein
MFDPAQLIQVLTNLVVNARDAIATTGQIEISTDCLYLDEYHWDHHKCQAGHYAILKVKDSGCGMSEEILERIFEPFYTTKDEGKGTGLGMATVYDIVKQHRGAINIISEPGKGSTIEIYFPTTEETSFALQVVSTDSAVGSGETILLVEDDIMLLDLWQTVLQEAGYRVIATAHPKQALSLARGKHIDLLLTDVIMPKLNGRELAGRLMATRPLLKVLYISGYGSTIAASRGLLDDDVELLAKPVSHDLLLNKIREILDQQEGYPSADPLSDVERI